MSDDFHICDLRHVGGHPYLQDETNENGLMRSHRPTTAPDLRCHAQRGARRLAFASLLCALASSGCSGEGTGPETVATLVVSPASATIASRAPLPLSASPRTAGGKVLSARPVTWQSSDTAIATVSATGLVTAGAVLDGTPRPVTITATSEGVAGNAALTVTPVPVASVTATPATATIEVGATQQFTAGLHDALAIALSGRGIVWSSSDTAVATVDASGLVTARPYGGGDSRTVTITATSEGRSGSATVQVTPLPVASLSVAPDSVAVGDTQLLSAIVLDEGGASLWGRAIAWSSSDTTVAVVNGAGLAIPVQRWDGVVRNVTITATSEGVSGSSTLTVLPAPVGSITIDPPSGTLASGATDTLVATTRTISGVILDGRTVSWASANPAVLAVDANGVLSAATVTGGTAVAVTVTATSEGFSAPAVFSVSPSPVASIAVTPDSVLLFPRMTAQLQVQLTNAVGTPLTGRAIDWQTSDPGVATVSAAGLITVPQYTGIDVRTAVVTATSEGHADTVQVVIEPTRVLSVSVSPVTVLMPAGTTQRITPVLRDALGDLLDRPVTWTTSDAGIATVSDSGVVTIVGSGTATITASADGADGVVSVSSLDAPLVPSSLVAGGYHHCGLTAAGAAYCWGWNLYGQLGDGTTTDATGPVAVSGGHVFASLAGGTLHTCGITMAGEAYCWGWNANGQLGDGTHAPRSVPTAVGGGLVFQALVPGFYHTCGLTPGGAAYCWGRNNASQLGDGTDTDRDFPVPVSGGHVFAQIIGKYAHTCGLTAAGAAYCWGRNFHGAIGDSTLEHRSSPVPMLGGRTFTQLVVGWDHSCGLTSAGETYCLGRNQYGQLGTGNLTDRLGFTRVVGVPAFDRLSSGYYHMCAMTADDTAYCWGRNHIGELGDGTTVDRPTAVVIGPTEDYIRIGGAYGNACASTASGVIQCWGTLLGGVLGDARLPGQPTFSVRRDVALGLPSSNPRSRLAPLSLFR